jgi:hypothetical protein
MCLAPTARNSLLAWGSAPRRHGKKSVSAESAIHVRSHLFAIRKASTRLEARLQRLVLRASQLDPGALPQVRRCDGAFSAKQLLRKGRGESTLNTDITCTPESIAADTAASTESESAVQCLSWRAFAVRKNFSNRRRKVIDTGTRHDDAVAASVSFLGDAQESPAVVLPELHVEMLALDLQFSRLDDVIHFFLRPPTLPHPVWGVEAKSTALSQISWEPWEPAGPRVRPGLGGRALDSVTEGLARTPARSRHSRRCSHGCRRACRTTSSRRRVRHSSPSCSFRTRL